MMTSPTLTVRTWIRHACTQLANCSHSPWLDSQLLLHHVTGWSKAEQMTWPEKVLKQRDCSILAKLLSRRCDGEPIAYLIGHKEFYSLQLSVTPATLIPRPESECLVNQAQAVINSQQFATMKLCDLGTGSGAIALALAQQLPDWHVVAVDNSERALEVARNNAVQHRIERITFLFSDWFSALATQKFSVIVANPPYLAANDPHLNDNALRFEPPQSLIADDNGLADLAHIIHRARNYLMPSGALLLEHAHHQARTVKRFLVAAGFSDVQHVRDYSGQYRISLGYHH